MINFLYLVAFSIFVSVVFSVMEPGDAKDKTLHGLKVFAQFLLISIALAWVLYFLPW